MQKHNIDLYHILDLLHIPEESNVGIFQKLSEALAYKIYLRMGRVLSDSDKKRTKKIIQNNSVEELDSLLKGKIDRVKLQEVIVEEREQVIKEFVQQYLSMLGPKEKEETLKRIDKYLP